MGKKRYINFIWLVPLFLFLPACQANYSMKHENEKTTLVFNGFGPRTLTTVYEGIKALKK